MPQLGLTTVSRQVDEGRLQAEGDGSFSPFLESDQQVHLAIARVARNAFMAGRNPATADARELALARPQGAPRHRAQ